MVALTASTSLVPSSALLASRCASAPTMGFFPSPKELSDDPEIADVLRVCKAEQAERLARMAAGEQSGTALAGSLPGTGPLGFFDPLGLSSAVVGAEVLYYRESELMHGRLAMMAVAGVIVQEGFHPFAPDAAKPAIAQLTAPPSWEVGFLVAFVSFAELIRANRAFTDLKLDNEYNTARTIRTLKSSYEPGNLGFDPLKLLPTSLQAASSMREKELNNGRLAMIASAGFVGQELVTGSPIFA